MQIIGIGSNKGEWSRRRDDVELIGTKVTQAYFPFTTNLPFCVVKKLADTAQAETSSRQRGMMNMEDYRQDGSPGGERSTNPEQNEKF